jgi:hypothetical protein
VPLSDLDIFVLEMARCARKHGFWLTNFGRPDQSAAYRNISMRKMRNDGYGIELYPSISITLDYDAKRWAFFIRITLSKSSDSQIVREFTLQDPMPALRLIDDFAAGRI